ncbi:MAG: hypothetical protein Kow0089_12660 [Desulfobulbaceae bacterium]
MGVARLDRGSVFSIGLFLLFALAGCVTAKGGGPGSFSVEDIGNRGRISFFLNLRDVDGPDLVMRIGALVLRSEEGGEVIRDLNNISLSSSEIAGGQKFLTRMAVPPGKYTAVRLVITQGGAVRNGNEQLLPLRETEKILELRSPVDVSAGDSSSLFLTWDTKGSLAEKQFVPAVSLAPGVKKLVADVAFVACPEIDTIFMISTEKNRVVDSLGIPGSPSHVFSSNDRRSDEVLALAEDDLKLYAFSASSNRITERYNLTTLNNPFHAAFTPDGRWGYFLDRQPGTVSRMDMGSGSIDRQVQLDYDPTYIIYIEKYNMIAVSVGISQNVVLLNGDTLETVGTLSTGTGPEGLRFVEDRYLYVAESGANSIMIYDLEANTLVRRVNVGFRPARILATSYFIYVANAGEGSLSVLRAGSLTPYRTVSLPGPPTELAVAAKFNSLYVGNREGRSLTVVDALTNEIKGEVELGAIPEGILIVQ